jgi:hypothetical protein
MACVFRGHKKIAMQNYGYSGSAGDIRVRRPMDIVLASVLVLLIVGCVVGYSVRAETASDRPAEPRRRRPF